MDAMNKSGDGDNVFIGGGRIEGRVCLVGMGISCSINLNGLWGGNI